MARTLLISTPHFPPEGGGLEEYVVRLAQPLMHEHGWRVVVVTSGQRGGAVHCDQVGDMRVYRLPFHLQVSATRLGISWPRDLMRIIKAEQPDLINAHLPTPGLADVMAHVAGSIPFVVTYHTGTMRKGRWPVDLFIGLYERVVAPVMLARATWVITSSDFVRDSHLRRIRAKSSTVTPGVDTDLFHPARVPALNRVLFVAGLTRAHTHKGLDALLPAIAELRTRRPALTLDVVGSGNDLGRYEELARSLAIDQHVRFLGRLAGERLARAYRDASVLALPTRNDSFPMVLLEALASGIPVVSTRVGGIPELVEDGRHGYLVEPGDDPAFTDRLGRILDDPALAAELGAEGRQKVLGAYTWSRRAAETNAIFEALLAGRAGDAVDPPLGSPSPV
jgi:glycosyltransferase involved in cell wall biosynthesis